MGRGYRFCVLRTDVPCSDKTCGLVDGPGEQKIFCLR